MYVCMWVRMWHMYTNMTACMQLILRCARTLYSFSHHTICHSEYVHIWHTHNALLICIIHTVALAVYSRSTSAYEALKSFNLLQLPSIKTL